MTMTTTSNLILPTGKLLVPMGATSPIGGENSLPPIQPISPEKVEQLDDKEKTSMLPKPTGYKVLCMLPAVSDKFEESEVGIVKADAFMKQEEIATTVLFVLALGPDAYKDQTKFPTGPWCKEGDFVIVRTYAGTRFKINGKEFRLLSDDQIEATVDDPRGVMRIGA